MVAEDGEAGRAAAVGELQDMRTDLVMLGGRPLEVAVPETSEELLAGWRLMPPGQTAMLFDLKPLAAVAPLWVPIAVGKDAEALDVVWVEHGIVNAIATVQGGCLQGYADYVLEMPAGAATKMGLKLGDQLVVGGAAKGH